MKKKNKQKDKHGGEEIYASLFILYEIAVYGVNWYKPFSSKGELQRN